MRSQLAINFSPRVRRQFIASHKVAISLAQEVSHAKYLSGPENQSKLKGTSEELHADWEGDSDSPLATSGIATKSIAAGGYNSTRLEKDSSALGRDL